MLKCEISSAGGSVDDFLGSNSFLWPMGINMSTSGTKLTTIISSNKRIFLCFTTHFVAWLFSAEVYCNSNKGPKPDVF